MLASVSVHSLCDADAAVTKLVHLCCYIDKVLAMLPVDAS